MKEKKEVKQRKSEVDQFEEVEITPEKDFKITWNHISIQLKEGESAPVPRLFLQNLVTEKVIKKLPE